MSKTSNTDYTGYIPTDGGIDEYHNPNDINNNEFQSMNNLYVDEGVMRKRPGSRINVGSLPDDVKGLYEYITGSGTVIILFISNSSLYKVNGSSFTLIDNGLEDERYSFHTQNGICYLNSATSQYKYDGTTFSNVGLPAPETAPTVAKNSTGLTGSYAWVYTFVIEVGGVRKWESDPSPVSSSLSLSNEGANVTPAASGDTRVNARYIYRSTAGGAKYYYEGKISNNTAATAFASGSVADASLGDEVEYTHGQPPQGQYATSGNNRQFWIKDDELYWSEVGRTVFYNEYTEKDRLTGAFTSYYKLPNNGVGTGIATLYNRASGFEDVYVFQEDSISVLQNSDPNYGLYTIRKNIGCVQHDSIVQYNDMLVFATNKDSIGIVQGGRFIDISTRKINKTIQDVNDLSLSRGELIFSHFYALTIRADAGKTYNTKTLVCDLRTIREVQNNYADAKWFVWECDIDYFLSLSSGTLLGANNLRSALYTFSLDYVNDETTSETYVSIKGKARSKNWNGKDLFTYIQPRMISIKGNFQRIFRVLPYTWDNSMQSEKSLVPVPFAAVAGSTLIGGGSTSTVRKELLVPFKPFSANTFSIEFIFENDDSYLNVAGYQLTVKTFGRYRS